MFNICYCLTFYSDLVIAMLRIFNLFDDSNISCYFKTLKKSYYTERLLKDYRFIWPHLLLCVFSLWLANRCIFLLPTWANYSSKSSTISHKNILNSKKNVNLFHFTAREQFGGVHVLPSSHTCVCYEDKYAFLYSNIQSLQQSSLFYQEDKH